MPLPPAKMTARLDIELVHLVTVEILRLFKPFNGLRQTIAQAVLRCMSSERMNQLVVANQTFNLTFNRAQALLVTLDLHFTPINSAIGHGITNRDSVPEPILTPCQ